MDGTLQFHYNLVPVHLQLHDNLVDGHLHFQQALNGWCKVGWFAVTRKVDCLVLHWQNWDQSYISYH